MDAPTSNPQLLERLRSPLGNFDHPHEANQRRAQSLCTEAAAEIERLRMALKARVDECDRLEKLCADTARTFMTAGRKLERAVIAEQEGSPVETPATQNMHNDEWWQAELDRCVAVEQAKYRALFDAYSELKAGDPDITAGVRPAVEPSQGQVLPVRQPGPNAAVEVEVTAEASGDRQASSECTCNFDSEPDAKGHAKYCPVKASEPPGFCPICYGQNGEHQKGCVDGDAPL